MKFLIFYCMMVVTVTNAGRIPRSFDSYTSGHNDHFPNLQTVHHGHGATSYQNFEIENHGEIAVPTKFRIPNHHVYPEHHDHEQSHYEVSSITEVPHFVENDNENYIYVPNDEAAHHHTSNNIEHIEINNIAEPSTYYDHYDQEYDYGYH